MMKGTRFTGVVCLLTLAAWAGLAEPAHARWFGNGGQATGERVTVPNVVSLNVDAAEAVLTTAGLMVWGVRYQPSDSAPAGTVIRQRPEAGSQVHAGSPVVLTVSAGSPARVREWFRNVYRRFAELDTDQSDSLSREEILAALSEVPQVLFDAIDADDDGQLSRAELEAFLQVGGLFGCARQLLLGGFATRMAGDALLSGLGLALLGVWSARRRM